MLPVKKEIYVTYLKEGRKYVPIKFVYKVLDIIDVEVVSSRTYGTICFSLGERKQKTTVGL